MRFVAKMSEFERNEPGQFPVQIELRHNDASAAQRRWSARNIANEEIRIGRFLQKILKPILERIFRHRIFERNIQVKTGKVMYAVFKCQRFHVHLTRKGLSRDLFLSSNELASSVLLNPEIISSAPVFLLRFRTRHWHVVTLAAMVQVRGSPNLGTIYSTGWSAAQSLANEMGISLTRGSSCRVGGNARGMTIKCVSTYYFRPHKINYFPGTARCLKKDAKRIVFRALVSKTALRQSSLARLNVQLPRTEGLVSSHAVSQAMLTRINRAAAKGPSTDIGESLILRGRANTCRSKSASSPTRRPSSCWGDG